MFRIEMLPAEYGDALLVSWGPSEAKLRHLLIDGGLAKTAKEVKRRIAELGDKAELELLVVTHVDNDHINGVLGVLRDSPDTIRAKKIWFNGWDQIKRFYDRAGPSQGNELSRVLDAKWKNRWNDKAVFVPDKGKLPTYTLAGEMKVTLLSPDANKLALLAKEWAEKTPEVLADDRAGAKATRKRLGQHSIAELAAMRLDEDDAAANGSSIAFLLEADGKRVLCGADAHPSVLLAGLERYARGERVTLDAFKLPHHGSERNISVPLLEKVACSRFLVSSNGVQFEHPDDVALARVVTHATSPTLYFNYNTERNEAWRAAAFQKKNKFTAVSPPKGKAGLVVEL